MLVTVSTIPAVPATVVAPASATLATPAIVPVAAIPATSPEEVPDNAAPPRATPAVRGTCFIPSDASVNAFPAVSLMFVCPVDVAVTTVTV